MNDQYNCSACRIDSNPDLHTNTYIVSGSGSKYKCKKQEMTEIVVITSSKISPNFGLFSKGRSSRGENKYSCMSTERYQVSSRHCG
jgi:hypothetical protein